MLRSLLLMALAVGSVTAHAQLQTRGVYVVSQGAFGANNATVVRVDPATGLASTVLSGRVYTQGAEIIGDRLYLTAGGGTDSRIDVVNLTTNTQVAQVTGNLVNPRYLAAIGGNRALVTNQTYSFQTTANPTLSVLDLATNTVTQTIPVVRQPEGVTVASGRAYVALGAFDERMALAVVDLGTLAAPTVLDIGCAARFVFTDRQDEVWAVCQDAVVVLNGATGAEVARLTPASPITVGFAQEAAYDATTQTVFAVAGSQILRFDTATNTATTAIAVPGAAAVSAIGYDPQNGRLYLGRPDVTNPFSAPGAVTVHDATGAQVASVAAGVYPAYVAVYTTGSVSSAPGATRGALTLDAPMPNPTAGAATVGFTLAQAGHARLVALDVLGREVAVLHSGATGAGPHDASFSTETLPAGVYLLRLTAGGQVATQRLTVGR